jgi:predicted nucleotidyltransferase
MRAQSLPEPATVDECIAAMTSVIVEQFHPEQIILFGSQARRNADARSDVDLLVVMPDDVDRRRTAIAITQAVSDIPVAKDIVVTTPAEIAKRGHVVGSVLRPALREGRTLYSRS